MLKNKRPILLIHTKANLRKFEIIPIQRQWNCQLVCMKAPEFFSVLNCTIPFLCWGCISFSYQYFTLLCVPPPPSALLLFSCFMDIALLFLFYFSFLALSTHYDCYDFRECGQKSFRAVRQNCKDFIVHSAVCCSRRSQTVFLIPVPMRDW